MSQAFNDFLAYKTAQRAEYQRVYGKPGQLPEPPASALPAGGHADDDFVEIFERDGTVKRTKLIGIGGQR